ncbi:MAG: hypothetical protein HN919_14000 [Verrucomicrobia bacterium]|jgi:uncharacterized protein|nr:hypothetical protein [Verrucomicrobiota bacterium]MBT7067411.1 hypothetical protein [Verrucomicrobiota bacterium]MBT7700067.1 hypothetical protein [Verrucomicrobiota bacterium]
MTSFLFGDSAEPLVGVYHAPHGRALRGAVLLCSSIGHEYMRAHWMLRRLADRLAAVGFGVMRFDYFGVGDSSGTDGEGRPARWQADSRLAMQELRDMSGATAVALVGLRLGGALAYEVATGEADISHLVLWDTVVRGTTFLDELAAMQQQHQRLLTVHQATTSGATEWLGALYPAGLQDEISRIDLLTAPLPAAVGQVHMVTSSHDVYYGQLHDHLAAHGAVTVHHVSEAGGWSNMRDFECAALGREALDRTVHIMEGGA